MSIFTRRGLFGLIAGAMAIPAKALAPPEYARGGFVGRSLGYLGDRGPEIHVITRPTMTVAEARRVGRQIAAVAKRANG